MSLPSYQEALDYAKARKVVLPSEFYSASNANNHGQLMTVSHLAGLSQIQAVTDDLMQSLEKGETFEDWQKRALSTPGVGGLPPGRTETIFRNFMQTAYNGGRWQQMERNKAAMPYVLFSAVNDTRTTPICRSLNGIIRRVDDPFWDTHSPQLHHRCRSHLIPLTQSQAEARSPGNSGLNQEPSTDPAEQPASGWGVKPTATGQADGLAEVLAEKLKGYPRSAWDRITALFTSAWKLLGGFLGKLIGAVPP